jgi:type VI secretion system protein ImpA
MERAIDEKFGRQAPALSDLKKTLDEVRALVEKVVKEKRILEPDPVSAVEATTQEGEVAGETVEGAVGIATGAILSRGDALRRLAQVAEYFRKTEPHSPVSYLVQRAISWGEMPLESWLQDVIKDGGVLASLRETLGIKGGADGGGSGGGEEW